MKKIKQDIINKAIELEYTSGDMDFLNKAIKFAEEKHDGQKRNNGDLQLEHALIVGQIVIDLNLDVNTVVAAIIHETINLSMVTLDEVKEEFGEEVHFLTNNLQDLKKIKITNNYGDAKYLRKVLVGLTEDFRVLIIKLADRLHNMRTIEGLPEEKRKIKALENRDILVPIAHRLGLYSIKSELENYSLEILRPDVYNEIKEMLDSSFAELDKSLNKMKDAVGELLTDHNINYVIKSRVKTVHSIYTKLDTGRKWSDIYDILAMRLLLDTPEDCYLVAGLIHSKFTPIPKRYKDFIAMPKANMYQSLHTSVYGVDGEIFEIQLRTPEMDDIAEKGVASHWSYKENGRNIQSIMEQKLGVFRNIIETNLDENNDDSFSKIISEEILSNQIYVYTPKGDVVELPTDATPVDFAYRIHSEVGDTLTGALVNDQIVPLDFALSDGDTVKLNTAVSSKPNQNWLNFVKTTQAKAKIKSYFNKKLKEEYISKGEDLLEKEIRKQKLVINEVLNEDNKVKLQKELKLASYEDVLLNIGSSRYTPSYVISILSEDKKSAEDIMLSKLSREVKKTPLRNNVIVDGLDNIKVTLASCCSPIFGDEILGFVTKGGGVSVHKTNCVNIQNEDERLVNVSWNENASGSRYTTKITIITNTSTNNLLEIITEASLKNINVGSIKEAEKDSAKEYEMQIQVKSNKDLKEFITALNNLKYVDQVLT